MGTTVGVDVVGWAVVGNEVGKGPVGDTVGTAVTGIAVGAAVGGGKVGNVVSFALCAVAVVLVDVDCSSMHTNIRNHRRLKPDDDDGNDTNDDLDARGSVIAIGSLGCSPSIVASGERRGRSCVLVIFSDATSSFPLLSLFSIIRVCLELFRTKQTL